MFRSIITITMLLITCSAISAYSFEIQNPVCIAPTKPGGGHDNLCRLLAVSFSEEMFVEMSVRYMPGGIGALAYNYANNAGRKDANIIIAASTGSALNLALGKFGRHSADDVRWLGAVAMDYGIIAVRGDSPWRSLDELILSLKTKKENIIIGAAGSIGSQDWMKAAMLFDKAGLDPKEIRYIPYEGGGEASNALLRNYIQVFPGDISEVTEYLGTGQIHVLAILSEKRLPGKFSSIPTAVEQGYEVIWPIWRGYYLPPDISNDKYRWWINTLYRLESTDTFKREREKLQMFPEMIMGNDFERHVKESVIKLRALAKKYGLVQ